MFVVGASLVAHLLFSRHGFNPTDDGFILAGARRILDGQVPHRDFISIRTAMSHVLHACEVRLGGSYCLLLSRFVFWVEVAATCWAWVVILQPALPLPAAIIAFCLSANIFPAMAWHTVDALLLSGIGLALGPSLAGYLLVGTAGLCRQNFLLLVPLLAVIHWDVLALTAFAPVLLYTVVVMFTGGMGPLLRQLRTHTIGQVFRVGVRGYINRVVLLGMLYGGTMIWFEAGWAHLVLPPLAMAYIAHTGNVMRPAWFLFGAGVPLLLTPLWPEALLALGVAWISSLSIGYFFPGLTTGTLYLLLAGLYPAETTLGWLVAGVTLLLTTAARWRFIYRQPARSQLTSPLGEVLPGGRGILTDETTHACLADLRRIATDAVTAGQAYAVIPDMAAEWIRSPQPNPLTCDWPQDTELGSERLQRQVQQEISSQNGLLVAVQKYYSLPLGRQRVALPDHYSLVRYVHQRGRRTGETEFFELYEMESDDVDKT